MATEIKERVNRKVDMQAYRLVLPPSAINALNLNNEDKEVVITVYDNKVVITKVKKK